MNRRAWIVLGVCAFGTGLSYVHRFGLGPLVPSLIADLRISYTAAGLLVSAYFWAYTAIQVPLGILTDRLGARRTMLVALAVLVVGVAAFAGSPGYAEAVIARGVVGLGAAGFWLPSLRLIREWFPAETRARATGFCAAGAGLGGTAALVLLPSLAEDVGWRLAYASTLVPAAIMAALTVAVIRAGPLREGGPTPGTPRRGGLSQVLRARQLWPIEAAVFCSYGSFVAMLTWLPAFLVERQGLTRPEAGMVTATITAGTIISWPGAGLLSDRLGRRKVVYVAGQALAALACLAWIWLAPAAGMGAALGVALLTGLAVGGMIIPFVMVVEMMPASLVGTASGIVNSFWLLGGLVIPPLLGMVLDTTRSFPLGFAACAGLQVLALLGAAAAPDTGRTSRSRHG